MDQSGNQTASGSEPPKTTFVQTDSTSFRDIVQRLTGGPPEAKEKGKEITAPNNKTVGSNSSASEAQTKLKLHERRQYAKPMLQIPKPAAPTANQIQQSMMISTNLTLHSPSSVLYSSTQRQDNSPSRNMTCFMRSPLSHALSSPINKRGFADSPSRNHNLEDAYNNVKERRLYLHSSPRSKEIDDEPELLTLFPLTSPHAT